MPTRVSSRSGGGVPAYLLAGGRSRRFGSDKARAALDGTPLVVRVARMVEPVARCVTVVAQRDEQYADLGLRTIGDREPGLGPLGGVHTAMLDATEAGDDWLLVASCDTLVLESRWLGHLLEGRTAEVDAVAFASDLDGWEPMPALYRASLHALARDRLSRGEGAMRAFLDATRARRLPLPPGWPAMVQANTPADLARHRSARGDGTG